MVIRHKYTGKLAEGDRFKCVSDDNIIMVKSVKKNEKGVWTAYMQYAHSITKQSMEFNIPVYDFEKELNNSVWLKV